MMINAKPILSLGLISLLGLALTGCVGNEDNTSSDGLVMHFAETHYQQTEVVGQLETAGGGYAQDQLEHHTLRDKNGVEVSLYRAYLSLDEIELLPCSSIAQLPSRIINFLLPSAYAHAGHGSEPVGKRALDKPNIIDLVTQDGFILPLGDTAIAPGRYCDVKVVLTRLAGEAYGKPEFAAASTDDPITTPELPDMSGKIFAIRSDYCAERNTSNTCVQRQRVDMDDANLTEPVTQTLPLSTPLELNSVLREACLTIGIQYSEWLADIDVSLLNTDINERQKLLNNISTSLQVYNQGLGDLPGNSSLD